MSNTINANPKMLLVTTVPITLRTFLLPYAEHFRRLGWTVDCLTREEEGFDALAPHFDTVHAIAWSRKPWELGNAVSMVRSLERLLREGRYDVVHTHTPIASFITRLAARRRAAWPVASRVVYTAHGFHFFTGNSPWRNALYGGLERLAAPWGDHLVTINSEDHQAALTRLGLPASGVSFFPGIGLDTTAYAGVDGGPVREELRIPVDTKVFLMVAEFNPLKNHLGMLEAMARLGRQDCYLLFAGVGPQFEACQARARQLGIEPFVRFLGYRRDVPRLLAAADALVLPSFREGLPRCILEAMSVGTPVIGADIRGIRDLLADGCGLLVPPGDVTGWRDALERLASDPELGASLAANARQRVGDYDIGRLLALHQALYRELLGPASAPAPVER